MSRDIAPEVLAAYRAPVFRRAFLVYIDYPTAPVFANDRTFPIYYDWDNSGSPTTFKGIGSFGSLGQVQEVSERRAQRLSLGLSGIDPEMLEKHLSEDYMGRTVRIWEAALDADWQMIKNAGGSPAPIKLWAGRIANQVLRLGYTASIEVMAASVEEDWENPRTRSYSDIDQQRIYPGDRGLEHVTDFSAGKPIKWGRA